MQLTLTSLALPDVMIDEAADANRTARPSPGAHPDGGWHLLVYKRTYWECYPFIWTKISDSIVPAAKGAAEVSLYGKVVHNSA